ncbi:MAG: tetratricopeptide repeat protein, partial [Planctomycetaceae bacterium]|nr:tetratricopeptide repeat protein [Planctomycetaceae bacterium]
MAKRSTSIPISPDALEPADNGGKSSGEKQHRSGSKSRPRRFLRPNWQFTLIVLVTLAVTGGTMHVVHEVQIHSMADELLVRSRELSSESRTAEAVQYLRRYLVLRPNETSSLAMLAELLQESASGSRQRLEAYLLNERVLQATPADQSVLRRQVDLALALDRSRDAVTHLEKLKEARPEDGELDFLYGRAFEADGRLAEAAVHYRTAIAQQYRKPLVYLQLASLLEQLGQPEAADGALAEMVTANADSAEAFLARATYRVRKGQFPLALEDLRQAEELAPQDREVILLRARLSLVGAGGSEDTVDTSTVREQLRGAINREPDVAELYLTAAQVELGEGQVDAAAKVLAEGCDRLPEDAQLELVRTDLLMTRDRLEDADKRIERLRQMRVSRPYLDYLEARLLVQQGEFVDAVPRLQAVADAAAGRLELRHLALLQLGHCCRKIGDSSGQLAASEQILAADPLSREARTTAAEALAKLGRIDEALEHYGHMAGKGSVSQEIARLLIARNLRMAPADRDWGAVTRVLEHAATEAEDPVPVYDLQATVLMLQGQIDTAQELLEQVRADDPTDARRWAAIIRLALRRGDAAKAEELLEEAATHTGDDVQLRLVRAELLARSADGADDTKFTSLMEETSGFSSEEQLQLLDGLSVIQFRRGHFDAAVRMWEQIVRQQPWRVDVLLRLFQSSLQNGDLQHSKELLDKMRQAEGGDGLHVRTAEALLLVRQAEEGDASGVATARQRLSQLAADYPHWSALSLAQARIEETAGNTQGAADHYLQAVSQGSRDPRVIRRVLELLLTLERQDDRIRLMEIIQQDATTVVQNSVQRLSAELALRSGRQEEAVRLARESMTDRESGSADYIWFGHILDAAGKSDDAIKAFDEAISLSSNRLLPWQAYISVLVRSDQPDAAREALTRAKEALPEKEARLLAAQSGTLLGEMEAAAENYQAALQLSPEDPEILRQAAGFYLQGGKDPGEAERLLRKYIALDPAPSAAR